MIKFKKMSTFAKVASATGVLAVTGVAFIPVINKFIDNPKSKVHVYEFNKRLFRTKEAAEDARLKFTAMSGLVKVMNGDETLDPNIDYKPLMAEFVSFVSKLFVVKVFKMEDDTATVNHFQYDGMSDEDKKKIMVQEINGQIQYGDLKDVTSLVKYATAHKQGSEWMFNSVDEMMLSVLGDGSGQSYSQNELEYADISKSITKLKSVFEKYYQDHVKTFSDKFNGIEYKLVHGLTHNHDPELIPADHESQGTNEGDGSGDEYTDQFILSYEKWGNLKKTLGDADTSLKNYEQTIKDFSPAKAALLKAMVDEKAVTGWNNTERYSTDELKLRDLLTKVAQEELRLNSKVIPGGHQDTNTNIIEGWNWAPTGDRTNNDYSDWQLQLAKDIQAREKLLSISVSAAPDGAVINENFAPTGDGTGNDYAQSVFNIKNDYDKTNDAIDVLTDAIDTLLKSGTVAAPDGGALSDTGQHKDAVGMKDDVDYTDSWAKYQEWIKLNDALKAATQARTDLEKQLAATKLETTPGNFEAESTLLATIDFDIAAPGENWKQNYNQDQVDYAKALKLQSDLHQQIAVLEQNGVTPAKPGALSVNAIGKGDQSDKYYAQEQLDLRDYLEKLTGVNTKIQGFKGRVVSAPPGSVLNPNGDHSTHENFKGTGDGTFYSPHDIATVKKYRSYTDRLADLNAAIKVITDRNPGLMIQGVSFADMRKNGAVQGHNNGQEFSQTEIDFTKDSKALKVLQEALKNAGAALTTMSSAVSEAKKNNFIDDYKNNKVPEAGPNEAPRGDKSDNFYSQKEVDYYNALKKIKDKFPDGNPWWAGADKKSDAAYAALYIDWQNALDAGTLEKNSPAVGDGMDHQMKDDKFKVFNAFFKQMAINLHKPGGADQNTVHDIDVIIKYLVDHGSLRTGNGFVKNSETLAQAGDTSKSGDSSGNTYLKLSDVWGKAYWTYYRVGTPGVDSSFSYTDRLKRDTDTYNKMLAMAKDVKTYETGVTTAQGKIDAYHTAEDAAKAKSSIDETAAKNAYDAEVNLYNNAKLRYTHFTDIVGSLRKYSPSEIIKLGSYAIDDNKATGALTDQQKKDMTELEGIDAKIRAASLAKTAADKAWAAIQTDENDLFLRYTKLDHPEEVIFGENTALYGDGSDKTYDPKNIQAKKAVNELLKIVKNHDTSLSDDDAKKEVIRLLKMQQGAIVGANVYDSAHPKQGGDQSGETWTQWDIDLYSKINSIQTAETVLKVSDPFAFAPEKAEEGKNYKPEGDGSGITYTSNEDKQFIEQFIPKFAKLVKDKQDADEALKKLTDRKTELEALHLSKDTAADPKTTFLTPDGKSYSLSEYKDAVTYVKNKGLADVVKDEVDRLKKLWDDSKWNAGKYAADHKSEYDTLNGALTTAKENVAALSQSNLDAWKNKVARDQKTLDDAMKWLKEWHIKNLGASLNTDPTSVKYNGMKVSTDFDTFFLPKNTNNGNSLTTLYYALKNNHANVDGSLNKKPGATHTVEEIKLRNALQDLATIPTGIFYDDIRPATWAFNVFFEMYKNEINNSNHLDSAWPKPKDYIDPTGFHSTERYSRGYKLMYNGHLKNHSAADLADFSTWLKTRFTPDTLAENHALTGTGKTEKFDEDFFKGKINGKSHTIKNSGDVANSEYGKYAYTLYSTFDDVKNEWAANKGVKYDPSKQATQGQNSKGSGDFSGKDYSADDIKYFLQYKIVQDKKKEVGDKQKVVNGYHAPAGTVLIAVPDSYKVTTGGPKHVQPLGDGSGNDYTQQQIEDVKQYYILTNQLDGITKDFATLQRDYLAHPEANDKGWDAMIAIPREAEEGLNHVTYWSQAEMDYQGQNILSSQIASDIQALQNQMIDNPDPKNPGKIKVTPAPDHAVKGFNSKPLGDETGITYSPEQIAKRDELSDLNQKLAAAKGDVKTFMDKGTHAAPDENGVAVADKDWHEKSRGDASGKTYDPKIWTDKVTLKGLTDAEAAAIKAKNDFITHWTQPAIDTILDEVKQGMVDGVNNEVKYSTDEIALREKWKQIGDEFDHLSSVTGDGDFGVSQTLTAASKVGENIAKVGLGDGVTYTKDELDLRAIIAKIIDEEKLHGITSEQQDAMSNVYLLTVDDANDDAEKALVLQNRPVNRNMGESVFSFYNGIILEGANKAVVGANHDVAGDASGNYYQKDDIKNFDSIVDLQAQIKTDKDEIKTLEDKGVTPAPAGGIGITTADAVIAQDSSLVGKHKTATGDKRNEFYTQDQIDEAAKYVDLQNKFDAAKKALEDFVNADKNLIEFFKYKESTVTNWAPVSGRNWTDKQFQLKKLIDDRDKLGVGRTIVNLGDGNPSEFGTNRGHLGKDAKDADPLVVYQGDDKDIKDHILGSDKVRIGYVLNVDGSPTPANDAPVLSSLENVAKYLQNHKELAPKGLIDKFALLQNMGLQDTEDIYKINQETVSKDRFNAMAENYQWGDK